MCCMLNSFFDVLMQGAEQIPFDIQSLLHEEDVLTSTPLLNLPGNLVNLTAQEVDYSVLAAARQANTPSEEVLSSKLILIQDLYEYLDVQM